MAETRTNRRASKGIESNVADVLPQLLDALKSTPYGEVKVILERGRIVQIIRIEKLLVD